MASQLAPLVRNEIAKAARRKLPYFGIFAVGLGCVIIYFVAGRLSEAGTANGWGYLAFSMQLVFTDLGPISILAFAAMLVAEETGTGSIRAALAAPVHRWEFYAAKAIVCLAYMAMVSVAAVAFSAVLASIHYRFASVGDSVGVVYSGTRVIGQFLLAYALSWVPLSALAMYGLLISTMIRSPGTAVAAAITTLFLVEFTKHLVGLDPYIFTRYINYPWLILQQIAQGMDYQWRPELWRMLGLCGASAVLTFSAGLILFIRRDLNH